MSMLNVNNLSMRFGGIKAVTDVSLNVEKGEIIGFIGPNGAGKTTLFNLLTGMYKPTSGNIVYNLGKTVMGKDLRPHKISHYGISRTFQNIRLFNNMSVLDNVLLGFHSGLKYGVASALLRLPSFFNIENSTYREALNLLDKFKIDNKKHELAKNLPYGEQRKLEIARALAAKPRLLLLDEPAAGMNPKETKELTALIKWIREEFDITIILIEHDMSLVMNICERIYAFDYGHMVACGVPDEIQNNESVIKAYLGEEAIEC